MPTSTGWSRVRLSRSPEPRRVLAAQLSEGPGRSHPSASASKAAEIHGPQRRPWNSLKWTSGTFVRFDPSGCSWRRVTRASAVSPGSCSRAVDSMSRSCIVRRRSSTPSHGRAPTSSSSMRAIRSPRPRARLARSRPCTLTSPSSWLPTTPLRRTAPPSEFFQNGHR
jgi:hypothetical protein